MSTDDFFRSRLDQMIDLRHSLTVLAGKMPWDMLEESLKPVFEPACKDPVKSCSGDNDRRTPE